MKLRSIALAGFLGTGILMTSGCGTGDLTGFVGDVLQQNVVYTVNGTGGTVTFSVTGDVDTAIADKEYAAHALTGHSSYDVMYDGGPTVSFNDGSVYIYTATVCSTSGGELHHEVNANKINIINLSENIIAPGANTSIVITQADGITEHNVTESISACGITGAPSLNSVVFENNMTIDITVDGTPVVNYKVDGIDPNLIAIGNSLKVDVVIFNDNNITAVPMAGYDDLIGTL